MNRSDWRTYQQQLNGSGTRRQHLAAALKFSMLVLFTAGILWLVYRASIQQHSSTPLSQNPPQTAGEITGLDKLGAQRFLEDVRLVNLQNSRFTVIVDGNRFDVTTSIDQDLQNYLLNRMDTDSSRYIGIIALDPDSGSILSMVGYNNTDEPSNPCTDILYPAASIFKIVTAAAALEKLGLTPDTQVKYNGAKHTLYKSQLKNTSDRYTTAIAFKDSFAQSVNPVFGKIGSVRLGKTVLEEYAYAFGFNSEIPFEIKNSAGTLLISEVPYNWAEIACGFNQNTKISVLHGALISAAVANGGKLIEPTIIDSIRNVDGKSIYSSTSTSHGQAISADTSRKMATMMQRTVTAGTFKKIFKGTQKDPVLSQLQIGAKSGSIGTNPRYDWFVGFATTTGKQPKRMALSIVVVHENYIGKKAGKYAREAIGHYFSRFFQGNQKQVKSSLAGKEKSAG